ncbi:MAG: TraR/DksA family transcriptional regulator [Desulfosalsimonas sp.]
MTGNKKTRRQMTGEELRAVRQSLLERKKVVWNEIMHELEHNAGQANRNAVDTILESGDKALEELFQSSLFYMVELKARELEDIEAAINRIDSGEYGRCSVCGRWIRPARLEVMPYSIRCRRCQEEHERIENV